MARFMKRSVKRFTTRSLSGVRGTRRRGKPPARAVLTHLTALLLSLGVLLCVPACGPERPDLPPTFGSGEGTPAVTEPYVDPVHRAGNLFTAIYGDEQFCIYDNKLVRFHFGTETSVSACRDATCDGRCPAETFVMGIAGISDRTLVFTSYPRFHTIEYVAYDIVTGEQRVLLCTESAQEVDEFPQVFGDSLYYFKSTLKEGGSAENAEDYERRCFRLPLGGGEEELLPIACGRIAFAVGTSVYYSTLEDGFRRYRTDTGEDELVASAEQFGYERYSYQESYGGYAYFACTDHEYYADANGRERMRYDYVRLDLGTGECRTLFACSATVPFAFVTEEGIYYYKAQSEHYLYVPPEEETERVPICNVTPTLMFCAHDGTGAREIYTNLLLDTSFSDFRDGKMYGHFRRFDAETERWAETTFYGVMDLGTGEVRKISQTVG